MPRFAANLTWLFTELPFLDRFAAAAAAGFQAVEFLFPYDHAPEALARRCQAAGLEVVLFNLWPGDWDGGERGLGALPGRQAAFADSLERARPYLEALSCRRIHTLAGVPPAGSDPEACRRTFTGNLRAAAEAFGPLGVDVLIEPINPQDIPGYFLTRQDQAVAILDEVGAENAALQMDLYHCRKVEGDPAGQIERHHGRIGHVQIADPPGRHEPGEGEIDFPPLFEQLDRLGYAGWIGCEYKPKRDSWSSLGWAAPYGISGGISGGISDGSPAAEAS